MPLEEKQQQLIEDFLLIENRTERFCAVIDRFGRGSSLSESEKCDANRVEGCVSAVWLVGGSEDGICQFRSDADSAIVRGVAGLFCDLFSGAPALEAAEFDPALLDKLKIADQLSPTRRRGAERICARIRQIAASQR